MLITLRLRFRQILAIVIVLIGLAAFVGHLAHIEWLYRWISHTQGMPFNVSIAVMLIGLGLLMPHAPPESKP